MFEDNLSQSKSAMSDTGNVNRLTAVSMETSSEEQRERRKRALVAFGLVVQSDVIVGKEKKKTLDIELELDIE